MLLVSEKACLQHSRDFRFGSAFKATRIQRHSSISNL
jgi:hypothetical protein